MMIRKLSLSLSCLGLLFLMSDSIAAMGDEIDWSAFLARHDLYGTGYLWGGWEQGSFSGNGLLGFMLYREPEGNQATIRLGRTDVFDHQPLPDVAQSRHDAALFHARLGIGSMKLRATESIGGRSFLGRTVLYDAEVICSLKVADQLGIVRAFTHATMPVIVVSMEDCADLSWGDWVPAPSISSRARDRDSSYYSGNPDGSRDDEGDIKIWVQPMKAGGDYVTAWVDEQLSPTKSVRYITVQYTRTGSSRQAAINALQSARDQGYNSLRTSHLAWWHAFWENGHFLSIPDTKLESAYWIQIYKMASATRPDRPQIDLQGPWDYDSKWPAIWWNLNVQLTYYSIYAAGMADYGESLLKNIERNLDNLAANGPDGCSDCIAIGRVSGIDLREPYTA